MYRRKRLCLSFMLVYCQCVLEAKVVDKGICTKLGFDCFFPFSYKGKKYTHCLTNLKGSWCGIKSHVLVRKQGIDFDYCIDSCPSKSEIRCTKKGYQCHFPFLYEGKNRTRCLSSYSRSSLTTWCSLTQDGTVKGNCADSCPDKGPIVWKLEARKFVSPVKPGDVFPKKVKKTTNLVITDLNTKTTNSTKLFLTHPLNKTQTPVATAVTTSFDENLVKLEQIPKSSYSETSSIRRQPKPNQSSGTAGTTAINDVNTGMSDLTDSRKSRFTLIGVFSLIALLVLAVLIIFLKKMRRRRRIKVLLENRNNTPEVTLSLQETTNVVDDVATAGDVQPLMEEVRVESVSTDSGFGSNTKCSKA